MEKGLKFKTVDEYIFNFPIGTRSILEELRQIVKKAAPQAEETISYNMPAFKLTRILVYYAAHKNHIGLYPAAYAIQTFKDELSEYKWSKGAIQFPLDKPLPADLISRIVAFRLEEVLKKEKTKTHKNFL